MSEHRETFITFVRPHWRRLHVVARRYLGSDDDAREAVQETVLRAWTNFSPSDERSYRAAWLFVILRNVAAEWARGGKGRVPLVPVDHQALTEMVPDDLTAPFAPLPSMDEEQFREFLDDRIVAALDGLEPAFREVVILSVAGNLTYREVAEVLDCPVGTVMSRMARARRALRERLSDFARARGWKAETRR